MALTSIASFLALWALAAAAAPNRDLDRSGRVALGFLLGGAILAFSAATLPVFFVGWTLTIVPFAFHGKGHRNGARLALIASTLLLGIGRCCGAAHWRFRTGGVHLSDDRHATPKGIFPFHFWTVDAFENTLNGIEATRRNAESSPRTRVLALSMHKDAVYVREILRADARGYLLKDSGEADLLCAVRAVAKGDGYLRPGVSDAVLTDYRKHVTDPIDLLSSRERDVLQWIAEEKTNKEIAAGLNLSVCTVQAHRGRIMEKLNLHSTGELVRFAVRNGLID